MFQPAGGDKLHRRFPEIALVVAGILGQGAFYARFGRSFGPLWLRGSVLVAVALPLLLVPPVEPGVVTPLPTSHDGGRPPMPPGPAGRLRQVCVAIAGAAYLGLAL